MRRDGEQHRHHNRTKNRRSASLKHPDTPRTPAAHDAAGTLKR